MNLRKNHKTPDFEGVYKQGRDREERTQQFRYRNSLHLKFLGFIFTILCFLLFASEYYTNVTKVI